MIPQLNNTYRYDVPLHGPQTVTVLAIHHDVWPTAYTVQWSDPDGHPMTLKTDDIGRFSAAHQALPPAMSRMEEVEAVIRRAHAAGGHDGWYILDEWIKSQEGKKR